MSILGWSLPAGCTTLPYDNSEAYEVKIDGVWVAWDEDNNVYVQTNSKNAREDGYEYIGTIEMGDDEDQNAALATFVRAHYQH
jgi:hypothetical protein